MITAPRCRSKKPAFCKFHGTDAGRQAFAILVEAQTTLDMAAPLGLEAYQMAAENYTQALLSYDATNEGLENLATQLSKPKNDVELALLEARRDMALAHIKREENMELLNTPAGSLVKEGRVALNKTTDAAKDFNNQVSNITFSLESYAIDANNYADEVASAERNFDLQKTGEALDNVENQATYTRSTAIFIQKELDKVKEQAYTARLTIADNLDTLNNANETHLAKIQQNDLNKIDALIGGLHAVDEGLKNLDTRFGYKNVPAEVETLTARARWNVDKISKIISDLHTLHKMLNSLF